MAIFKAVVKSVAKGYMALADKTRGWTAAIREDLRDAVETARYEREMETMPPEPEPRPARKRAPAKATAASKSPAGASATTAGKTSRRSPAKATAEDAVAEKSHAKPTGRRGPRRATAKATHDSSREDRPDVAGASSENSAETHNGESSV